MAKKRTTAQRRAAAKAAWALRRLRAAGAPSPVVETRYVPSPVPIEPAVTVSVTKEGQDFYLGISNNGSLHRVKVGSDTLRTMALDALRII